MVDLGCVHAARRCLADLKEEIESLARRKEGRGRPCAHALKKKDRPSGEGCSAMSFAKKGGKRKGVRRRKDALDRRKKSPHTGEKEIRRMKRVLAERKGSVRTERERMGT